MSQPLVQHFKISEEDFAESMTDANVIQRVAIEGAEIIIASWKSFPLAICVQTLGSEISVIVPFASQTAS